MKKYIQFINYPEYNIYFNPEHNIHGVCTRLVHMGVCTVDIHKVTGIVTMCICFNKKCEVKFTLT